MDLELCCFATQLLDTVEINDGVAAWAQFVGAMGAIAATWLIAHREAKRASAELADTREREAAALRRAEEAEAARLASIRKSAAVIASMARSRLESVEKIIREARPIDVRPASKYLVQEMREANSVLRAYPFWELGSPATIAAFTAVLATVHSSIYWLDRAASGASLEQSTLADALADQLENLTGYRDIILSASEER